MMFAHWLSNLKIAYFMHCAKWAETHAEFLKWIRRSDNEKERCK